MLKVLTAEQMREVDRLTTERYGIPSIILMENAAHAVARVITEKLGGSVKGKSILILCGKGNNGGDGAAIARLLWQQGAFVYTVLIGRLGETSRDAYVNFTILERLTDEKMFPYIGLSLECCPEVEDWEEYLEDGFVQDPELIVDCLFGTGLRRPISGIYQAVISWIEASSSGASILSVDLPSGLNSDSAETIGRHVEADFTVTFTSPKAANLLPPAARFNGELILVTIGSPEELVDERSSRLFLSEKKDAVTWFERAEFSVEDYKNKRGHALIFAGSEDYSGAAVMCGNAAIRSGVGLTTLVVPVSCKVEVASRVIPEVIVKTLAEKEGEVCPDAFVSNEEVIRQADSILLGPGLKATDRGVEKLVREIALNRKVPVVVDAGALWFFNALPDATHKPARKQGRHSDQAKIDHQSESALAYARACVADLPPIILTPHEGEFLRLLGTDEKNAIKDRVSAVREYAVANGVILVLKGERVLIGSPDGRVVVNPTGNSGLGKAGNGDTLAGILAGFVAQAMRFDIDIFETVVAAVYIAGMAGDIAEKKYGKRVMTASDVRECLADVFEEFEEKI